MLSIFTGANSDYFSQVAALIKSLISSQSENINFSVVGNGWTDFQKEKLSILGDPGIAISFIDASRFNFSEIKLSGKFPLATIYNLLGPKYLFSSETKMLYLDADILVVDDLNELWNSEFDFPVAAVTDSHIGVIGNPSMWRPWRELNANPMAKYLNTGVLLIDVARWNELEITDKCLTMLSEFKMPCIDQDALSIVLNGDYYSLHPKFNLMPMHFMPRMRYSELVDSIDSIHEAILSPAVIHFHRSFYGKPWNAFSSHPYKMLWRNYAKLANPSWKLKLNLKDLVRQFIAKAIGLSKIDPVVNNNKLTKLG